MDRLEEIEQRLAEIRDLLDDPNADLDALEREVRSLTTERTNLQNAVAKREAKVASVVNGDWPVIRTFGDSPETPAPLGDLSDPARRTIDRIHKRGLLPDAAATVVERLVTSGDEESRSLASRWAQATGDDHYARAFFKLLGDPNRGHMLWSEEERAAFQRVEAIKKEMRGLTTGTGSAMLPLFLDPAILLTSEGSTNPLRKIARIVRTTSNTWQGVTSSGVTAEWKTEGAQAADASPAVAPASIPVFFGDAFVPYSYEIEQDGLDFTQELAKLLIDAADQLQAAAFTTGVGSTEPTGFVTALAGTDSEVEPASPEAFGSDDVYALQNALPARFQPRAQWVAGLPTINSIAQFETTNGARLFPEISDGKLLRRPMNECSNMKDTDDLDTGADADNLILCYGEWQNFIIADRIGSMIEVIPQVFGTDGRPTGQRGAFLWFRTGSDVVVNEAFRILNVATAVS
ncbi:MAG: phage major capsid protein [Armatimonadetes bacterium]|nr:phage major capsid protein [Armatimonadota bacterium]